MKFFLLVLLGYIFINIFFGLIYTLIGIEEITTLSGNRFKDFLNGFFFSAQTITTVGYGGVSPHGFSANIVSAFEALIGLLSFSFITGLLYGRFSKPKAAIKFSSHIIHRDFNGRKALMFRLMNKRTSIMIEPEITVTLVVTNKGENTDVKRTFYELKLEKNKIRYLPTTWTIVHEIDEESPLVGLSEAALKNMELDWYILMQYHEESFAQKVYQIHSYNTQDLTFNVQFSKATSFSKDGFTVLNHHQLDALIPLEKKLMK